jgi:membrane complex biogenesis BtpA family protein
MRFFLLLCSFIYATLAIGASDFDMIFPINRPILAAVMLDGEYETPAGKTAALEKALAQLKIAQDEGVDSILFEFRGGEILTPAITKNNYAGMLEITKTLVAQAKNVVIGVEILWHYPKETIRLAKESGAKYVRLDFFSDEVIADGKPVPINPAELMAYKQKIGADDVVLLTDIQVKYSTMMNPNITITESATTAERAGSKGVIVSGKASGNSPNGERVRLAKLGVNQAKVIIGSGLDYENAPELLQYADGAIVGTSISTETGGVLVPAKVRLLMEVVRRLRD